MKRREKRPLKDQNIHESPKVSKQTQSTFGSDFTSKCKISSTPDNEQEKNTKLQQRKTRKELMESPSAGCKMTDNYFAIPKAPSPQGELSDSSPIADEVNKSSEATPTKILPCNEAEIILTVNKLFMEDLRCPQMTPFSPITFSCSSLTNCAFVNHQEETRQVYQKDEQVLMFLICEDCWNLLLSPLHCHLTATVYFTPLIFRSVLYGITVEANEKICLRLVDILKTHLQMHPPCRKNMKKIYFDVLVENLKKTDLVNTELVKYSFLNIVKAIEETCHRIAEAEKLQTSSPKKENKELAIPTTIDDVYSYISKKYINNDDILSLPEFNYQRYENQQTNKKIDSLELMKRLMLILDIALDILEENFRMWWMKSRYKLKEKINSRNSCPFIAEIAWKKSEVKGSINEHCVQVFMLFKKCPAIHRHNISRYIALLFEIARANEENQEMEFPFFSTLCYNFAEELASHIKGEEELSDKTVDLVSYVYPDWLRFRVGGILLKSDISSSGVDDLRSIYRIILRNLKPERSGECTPPVRNLRQKLKLPNLKNNTKNSEGETLIHKYCRTNNTDALKKCLQFPETKVNLGDNAGWTPLHNAATYNSIDSVKLLIKHRLPPKRGAEELDILCLNSENESPLMCAVKQGNTEIVDILLKNGAGPTVWNRNSSGSSSVDLAPNEHLKNMLLNSWKESISSFECLSMKEVELELLTLMLTSYCSVYHTGEKIGDDMQSSKHDIAFKFNYAKFYKDQKTIERLSLLVNKLSKNPSNPSYLKSLLVCI